jgi:SAM-dependent methyltransferase
MALEHRWAINAVVRPTYTVLVPKRRLDLDNSPSVRSGRLGRFRVESPGDDVHADTRCYAIDLSGNDFDARRFGRHCYNALFFGLGINPMNESSKLFRWRVEQGHFSTYLCGRGIDIGAGPDPLKIPVGTVRQWDVSDGDAQYLHGVEDQHYDFVYSSHCLEHLHDVPTALGNWARVLRPSGFLYVIIPDYQFYEKLTWPSRFNRDHKQSFSLTISREQVKRSNHWTPTDLLQLFRDLSLASVEFALQLYGFDYNRGIDDQTLGSAVTQIYFIARKNA